jgi:hypothetical protein
VTAIEGGLRSRFIRDSLEQLVVGGLAALGWFGPGRDHSPIAVVDAPNDWDEPVEINSLAFADGGEDDIEMELGSTATEDRWVYYIDFYAEDESVGLHLSGDVRDILRGKLSSIGRTNPSLPVYDYRNATPPVIFHCYLENVLVDRAKGFNQPWLRYWFSVRVDVVDENFEDVGGAVVPGPGLFPGLDAFPGG